MSAPMPYINDAQVNRIIGDEIAKAPGAATTDKVYQAFRTLQARRRTAKDFNNQELAAAEHYMYARFLAGRTGDPMVLSAPELYDQKKKIFFGLGIEDLMSTSSYPGLPPSPELLKWGKTGAAQGLIDFTIANRGKSLQPGEALKPLLKGSY